MIEQKAVDQLHSYPKIYNMGHRAIKELFDGEVVVQEKVDGSQFSFGVIGGTLYMRSKGAAVYEETCDKLFKGAAEYIGYMHRDGKLVDGWQYRGEVISRSKHNTLTYATVPPGNIILFDVDDSLEGRISPKRLDEIGEQLGLMVVPTLFIGKVDSLDSLHKLIDKDSCLGGCKIEGIVVKNYARWGVDGKMLMGKIVSADFKEQHTQSWKAANPARADIIELLKQRYRHERRWEKAIEHRRDSGQLLNAPQDIGPLMAAIPEDIIAECEDEIADALYDAFIKDLKRGWTSGFPEWYLARLAAQQFEETPV